MASKEITDMIQRELTRKDPVKPFDGPQYVKGPFVPIPEEDESLQAIKSPKEITMLHHPEKGVQYFYEGHEIIFDDEIKLKGSKKEILAVIDYAVEMLDQEMQKKAAKLEIENKCKPLSAKELNTEFDKLIYSINGKVSGCLQSFDFKEIEEQTAVLLKEKNKKDAKKG